MAIKTSKKKNILTLFKSFFKIGLFTFGGGYAMIPLIQEEMVNKYKFISEDELLNIFAIAESTPGVIAVNTATFIGHKIAGFSGASFATLGVVLPSFLIIILIWTFLSNFQDNFLIKYALEGVKIGVVVLILRAALHLKKSIKNNLFNIALMSITFLLISFTNISVIFILIIGIILGIIYNLYVIPKMKEDKK